MKNKHNRHISNTHIVIAGLGFGGAYVYKRLHRSFHKNPSVSFTLINQTNYFLFTPLLHEVATGGISPDNAVEPLRRVFTCCTPDIVIGGIQSVSPRTKMIRVNGDTFSFDFLVLALGSQTDFFEVPGAREHSFPLKSLEDALRLKNHCIEMFDRAARTHDTQEKEKLLRFVIIGGGPTGVELAGEMSQFFYDTFCRYYTRESIAPFIDIVLVQRANSILPMCSGALRARSELFLKKKGVRLLCNVSAAAVEEDGVLLSDGVRLSTATTVWVAGIRPHVVSSGGELPLDERGRILVNEHLAIEPYQCMFAIGDMTCVPSGRNGRTVPALAQATIKQAALAADNIIRAIKEQPLKSFYYRQSGFLLSIGQWRAVAEVGPFFFSGRFAWWLWRTIYLFKLLSVPKKIKVAIDWTLDLVSPRDISKINTCQPGGDFWHFSKRA